MKIMQTIDVPAHKSEYIKEIKCDICGTVFRGTLWTNNNYRIEKTEATYREGDNFPEGGNGTETIIDICPECFKNKLIPWVRSFGVSEPTIKDWET